MNEATPSGEHRLDELPTGLSDTLANLINAIDERDVASLDQRLRETVSAVETFKVETARREGVKVTPDGMADIEETWGGLFAEFVAFTEKVTPYARQDSSLEYAYNGLRR